MHLRHFERERGPLWHCPERMGRTILLPRPPHSVPCTEGASLGLLLPNHPGLRGVGGRRGRGCEVAVCDCQQQRRKGSWWQRWGKVTTLLGRRAIKTS